MSATWWMVLSPRQEHVIHRTQSCLEAFRVANRRAGGHSRMERAPTFGFIVVGRMRPLVVVPVRPVPMRAEVSRGRALILGAEMDAAAIPFDPDGTPAEAGERVPTVELAMSFVDPAVAVVGAASEPVRAAPGSVETGESVAGLGDIAALDGPGRSDARIDDVGTVTLDDVAIPPVDAVSAIAASTTLDDEVLPGLHDEAFLAAAAMPIAIPVEMDMRAVLVEPSPEVPEALAFPNGGSFTWLPDLTV